MRERNIILVLISGICTYIYMRKRCHEETPANRHPVDEITPVYF
jgi:hypothetical protein